MLASERGLPLRRDELTFMDKSRNLFFQLEPRGAGLPAASKPPPDAIKLAILVRRPGGANRDSFLAEHDSVALPALVEGAVHAQHWGTHGTGGPGAADEPPYDAITFLWIARERFDPQRLRDWQPDGARVLRLRVSEHVTPLPDR